MGETRDGSPSSIEAALVGSLSKITSTAVPGLVDALLLITQCSPSSLLLGLLQRFPEIYQSGAGQEKLPSGKEAVELIQTYLAAVLHLLKHQESGQEDLLRALWTVYIPLLRSRDPDLSILQIQVAEMLAEATSVQSEWNAVGKSLGSLCLNSLYASSPFIGESTSAKGLKTSGYSDWHNLEKEHNVVAKATLITFHDELLPLYPMTQMLAALLTAALEASSSAREEIVDEGRALPQEKFCEDVVAVFLRPALAALSQPLDESLRRHSMQNLLPPLLASAARFGWAADESTENRIANSRIAYNQHPFNSQKFTSAPGQELHDTQWYQRRVL